MLRTLWLLPVLLFAFTANAQTAFRNYDANSGPGSSSPLHLTQFNGKLYFYGNSGNNTGRELMEANGVSATLIQNINPGIANSIGNDLNRPIAGLNGVVYFTADNGSSGLELYSYNGTSAKLEADITFDADSSTPDNYVVLNNRIYFTATTAAHGKELYMFNPGTSPQRVTDINAGAANSVTGPTIAFNARVYFVANTAANGAELWAYNPVTDTAILIADIDTGAASSNPANFTLINNKVYFSATTFTHGRELYEFDGNSAPKRLTDISASALSSLSPTGANAFASFNNKIYFAARDTSGARHMYTYDPANQQVALAFKINNNGNSSPSDLVVYNNKLFFSAYEPATGFEIYSYDGTNPPAIVEELCTGTNSTMPQELTMVGDELYMSATDCQSGTELWGYNYKRVSVATTVQNNDALVYPNPVTNELHIQLQQQEPLQVSITDIYGRAVYQTQVVDEANNRHITIPMQQQPAGFYVYLVTGKSGTVYLKGKFLKQ